jgi:hypothetical protein
MAVNFDSGVCTWSPTTPVTWSGPNPQFEIGFTVTVDADEQDPSSDGVQVRVLEPARVAVSLQASPYRTGDTGSGPWSATPITSQSNLTVATRTAATDPGVDPTVWYFLRLENVSGTVTGQIEGFTLTETTPSGGTNALASSCTGPFGSQYSFPRSIAPGARLDCFIQRTRSTTGNTTVTTGVTLAAGTVFAPSQPESVVTVQATCNGSNDRQVPMLVDKVSEAVSGTTARYTLAEARTRWTAAGFSASRFAPATGNDNDRVLTQSQQAFSCQNPSNTNVTVTHAP